MEVETKKDIDVFTKFVLILIKLKILGLDNYRWDKSHVLQRATIYDENGYRGINTQWEMM